MRCEILCSIDVDTSAKCQLEQEISKVICFYDLKLPNLLLYCFFTGKIYEKVCEMCHITLNKVTVFSDHGKIIPGGVRIGKCRSH